MSSRTFVRDLVIMKDILANYKIALGEKANRDDIAYEWVGFHNILTWIKSNR
jgi:hypothetical protein